MPKRRKKVVPQCYCAGCKKPARFGRFCTQRAAADYAVQLHDGANDGWCSQCMDWVFPDPYGKFGEDRCRYCGGELLHP